MRWIIIDDWFSVFAMSTAKGCIRAKHNSPNHKQKSDRRRKRNRQQWTKTGRNQQKNKKRRKKSKKTKLIRAWKRPRRTPTTSSPPRAGQSCGSHRAFRNPSSIFLIKGEAGVKGGLHQSAVEALWCVWELLIRLLWSCFGPREACKEARPHGLLDSTGY